MIITIKNLEGFQLADTPGTIEIIVGEGGFDNFEELFDAFKIKPPKGASKTYIRDRKKIVHELRQEYPEYFL